MLLLTLNCIKSTIRMRSTQILGKLEICQIWNGWKFIFFGSAKCQCATRQRCWTQFLDVTWCNCFTPWSKDNNLVWVSGTFSSGLPGPKKSLQATFEKPTTPSVHELTPTPTGTSTQQPQGDSGAFWVAACSYFLPTSVQFKPSHLPGETFLTHMVGSPLLPWFTFHIL